MTPRRTVELLDAVRAEAPGLPLGVHFHDTRGTGQANALAAILAGITQLDASVGGLGGCPFAPGASGNIATEELVYWAEESGIDTGIDLDRVVDAARVTRAGRRPRPAQLAVPRRRAVGAARAVPALHLTAVGHDARHRRRVRPERARRRRRARARRCRRHRARGRRRDRRRDTDRGADAARPAARPLCRRAAADGGIALPALARPRPARPALAAPRTAAGAPARARPRRRADPLGGRHRRPLRRGRRGLPPPVRAAHRPLRPHPGRRAPAGAAPAAPPGGARAVRAARPRQRVLDLAALVGRPGAGAVRGLPRPTRSGR